MGNPIERKGVHGVGLFFSSNGWIFREQTTDDYGIDAHVEIPDEEGKPTGKLVAIQIKSGKSYFNNLVNGQYIHSTTAHHAEYWLNHSLPVIIILVNTETNEMFWQHVDDNSTEKARVHWKIKVPLGNTLCKESLKSIASLSEAPMHIQKINRLRLDRPLMELVESGERVYIEFYDWINKMLSRYDISLKCDTITPAIDQKFPFLYGPGLGVADVIEYVLPWASFETDEDERQEYLEPIWAAECYMGYDKEDDFAHYSESFGDWYERYQSEFDSRILPVFGDGAEVEGYRLYLSLNDLGKAFLLLDDFLQDDSPILLSPPK